MFVLLLLKSIEQIFMAGSLLYFPIPLQKINLLNWYTKKTINL